VRNIGRNCVIDAGAVIDDSAIIADCVRIAKGAIIHANVVIAENVVIGPYCIIGEPAASWYGVFERHSFKPTKIGANSIIRSHSVIYEDVEVGKSFMTGHHVTIREDSVIGNNCSVGTFSDLQGKLRMGEFVRLHSNVHIGQLTVIENYVWIYPYVVTTNDPYPPMGNLVGSTIREYAQIATGSIIMPGMEIGRNALVGAQSLVNKSVAEERVVVGVPARDICSVRDIRDKRGMPIYPWKEHLNDFRGYPWQELNPNDSTH